MPDCWKGKIDFQASILALLTFENCWLAWIIDFRQFLSRLWCETVGCVLVDILRGNKNYYKKCLIMAAELLHKCCKITKMLY